MGREEIAALRAAGGALRAALRDARACAGPAGRGLLTGGSARNNSQGARTALNNPGPASVCRYPRGIPGSPDSG